MHRSFVAHYHIGIRDERNKVQCLESNVRKIRLSSTTYLVKAFICARQDAIKVVTVLRRSYPCVAPRLAICPLVESGARRKHVFLSCCTHIRHSLVKDSVRLDSIQPLDFDPRESSSQAQEVSLVWALWEADSIDMFELRDGRDISIDLASNRK